MNSSSLSRVQYGELEAQSPQILEMRNAGGKRDFSIQIFFIRLGIEKTPHGDALRAEKEKRISALKKELYVTLDDKPNASKICG